MSRKVHKTIQLDDGDIIVQIAGVKLRVDGDAQHIKFNVWEELAVIVDIPLAQPDPDLLWPELLDAMCCSEKMRGIYERPSAHVDIVILLLLQ